jgi:nucleoid-associated protein YgaU
MTRTIDLSHQAAFCLTSSYPSCKRFRPVGTIGPGYLIPVPRRRQPPRLGNGEIDRASQAGQFVQRVLVVLLIVGLLLIIGLGGPRVAALMLPAVAPAAASPAAPQESVLTVSPAPTPSPSPVPTASPTASPTRSPSPAPVVYRVKQGDNLASIAARYGVTVQAIKNANKLKNAILHVGQKLVIPPPH